METTTKDQIITALIKYASNQKRCDKYSIAYMCGMMNANSIASIYVDSYTRKEVLMEFTALVNYDQRSFIA